ncbi:uncharacterized protein RJT21DRAFT_141532 [Scheffersomyces amazonensis]|uniref:uncharacterized protein n=1 Tax=Scheffersomyces amazonensis TaxID=1078765 RepID=UPI00315C4BF3
MSGGVSKKAFKSGGKSSDRRLAGSRQAASYLHSSVKNSSAVTRVIGAPLPPKTSESAHTPPIHPPSTSTYTPTTSNNDNNNNNSNNNKTVKRQVGTQTWEDSTLVDWDPKHFRLFVGNLGEDVTEQLLHDTFKKYATMSKVRVPLDKKSGKNKGFGFVAFADANDYFHAFKDMNGKYIGQHPVQLKRAETPLTQSKVKNKSRSKTSNWK